MSVPRQGGSAAVPLVLAILVLFAVFSIVNANRERRLRNAREAGSLVHAEQVQAVLDNYGHQFGRYPTTTEFVRLMSLVKPLYPGLVNTHSCLPTEPRIVNAMNPGAINLGVAPDGCSDTIRVIGTNRTVIWTIVGRVDGKVVIYGGVPIKHRSGLNRINPFPHG